MSDPHSKPRPASTSSSHSTENSPAVKPSVHQRRVAPTKAETALLPAFSGLNLEQIYLPSSPAECQEAVDEIFAAAVTGFDTEAKPTFRKGEKSAGPHIVQFALTDKAYIFQLHRSDCEKAAAKIIASKKVLKVGFGLKNDHSQILRRFGITLNHVLDLDQTFRKIGYGKHIGVRGAIGAMLKQGFKKSKSVTMSNWALPELTQRQLLYAANDSYAALKIMEALQQDGHFES